MPRAMTRPPRTAVRRVDLRRQSATTMVALSIDMEKLPAPSQPVNKWNIVELIASSRKRPNGSRETKQWTRGAGNGRRITAGASQRAFSEFVYCDPESLGHTKYFILCSPADLFGLDCDHPRLKVFRQRKVSQQISQSVKYSSKVNLAPKRFFGQTPPLIEISFE